MTKLERIRKEYGSFRAAVEHYAGMGCSRALTARYLDISRKYFTKLVLRFDLDGLFPERKDMVYECRRGNPDAAEQFRKLAKLRIIPSADLLAWVQRCRTMREFNARAPYNVGTVFKRFGSWTAAKDLARQQVAA